MKIASLFDGSGGFPLAGMQCGMTPIWASEVEPYPIRVTKDKIPGMKHLGSVTEIRGDQVEIPDVITFGSPCQDLSVAGKQKGIHEGERSSLFFEAIRIIKEMRAHDRATGRADEHVRPRFAVWENVPGAYSSNGGRDFQAVLQAFCDIGRPGDHVPFPQKWGNAGCIVGEGYSIAWRTYDAQFWAGTPQRRKRIYLIADFGSERAGEILFEQESVPGDHQPGEEAGQGTAENPVGGLAGSDQNGVILDDQGGGQISVRDDGKSPTLRAEMHGHPPCVVGWDPYNATVTGEKISTLGTNCGMPTGRNSVMCINAAGFVGRQGAKSGSVGYEDEKSPTLRQGITTDCVYAIEGKCIDRNSAQNGKGWSEDQAPTINATDRHGVCMAMDVGFFATAGGVSPTLLARMYKDPHVAVYDTTQITSPANYSNPQIGDPCHPLAANQHAPLAIIDAYAIENHPADSRVKIDESGKCQTLTSRMGTGGGNVPMVMETVCIGNGQMCNITMAEISNTLDCMHDQQAIMHGGNGQRKYIVRRLTPLECNRLQGFPDGWGNVAEITELSDEEHDFWMNVRNTHAAINGKKQGNYTKDQMIRWLNALHTDSAEYKMWGNGIALPCARDVMRRIAKALKEEP